MIRVLFVCMGNICRSPMAEAVFQHMVKEAGLENQIEADSAGTGDWHRGEPAHHGTLAILQKNNIPYAGRSRIMVKSDLDDFDYIVAMDERNRRDLREMFGNTSDRVKPLLDYGVQAKQSQIREVPDPYFDGGFETVYLLAQDGCAGLLETIRRAHNL
ncbi:MAG TPA: low molecular weight protein-tyrosine-phosphatase [Abditibacteriaceae bacterium]|jgi:protein-tyrosine phosphatase